MITIIDYGMGNLRSVAKAFEALGFQARVTQKTQEVLEAEKVVLPGVGAFGDCIKNLQAFGLYDAVNEVLHSDRAFLGICLGLQVLFEESEEGGRQSGFGVLNGRVVRFPTNLKVPHMGWNRLVFSKAAKTCPLLKGVQDGSYVYFVHSYYGMAEDELSICRTDYGVLFTSMIWRKNLFATQFHPEKSQEVGLRILRNFAEL